MPHCAWGIMPNNHGARATGYCPLVPSFHSLAVPQVKQEAGEFVVLNAAAYHR